MPNWNADTYLRFGNERTQPALDLLHRVNLTEARSLIDVGCGPGNSTEPLRRRWPEASILGLDSSEAMIEKARSEYPAGDWQVGDAASWQGEGPFDLVFSNAVWHWLPDHARLCRHWVNQLSAGGALAVQMPAHYDSPLHREMLEVSGDPAWSDRMVAARTAQTHHPPAFYYDILRPLTARVELWETTYYHVLAGPDAILDWFRGTGLRPYLEALETEAERQRFEAMLLARYRMSYPAGHDGKVLFPFRRLFFIAYC